MKAKLDAKTYTTIIIIFNVLMVILLFTTSELILLRIVGYEVISISTSVQYEYPLYPSDTPIPTALPYSIPNYPLMLFIIALVVNIFLYYRVRKTNTTLQN